MATLRSTFSFIRTNPTASLMFLVYILMWWAPLRPIMSITTGRTGIPYGINGPLEWMSRWWLSPDSPTFFQPIALIAAWILISQRRRWIQGAWARTCRSASRRGAKWAKNSWIPLGALLTTGAVAFLGHITPLAISALVWLPIAVTFYIYGPRVVRALHTPMLLLIAATALPDTIPELIQKLAQRLLGTLTVMIGKVFGDSLLFDAGSPFNVADDYVRVGDLNAPIAAPMNGLALIASTAVITATWTLIQKRGIASTAAAKLLAITLSCIIVLGHITLIAVTLHNGHKGYAVASFHGISLLPVTSLGSILILKRLFAAPFGQHLREVDRRITLWFVNLPDFRRKPLPRQKPKETKSTKSAPPMIGVLLRMMTSPFRIYWQWMTRLDAKLSKWEAATSKSKRSRK